MQRYWTAFAKTGNPNGHGLPEWPTYDRENDQWLTLNYNTTPKKVSRAKKLGILENALGRWKLQIYRFRGDCYIPPA